VLAARSVGGVSETTLPEPRDWMLTVEQVVDLTPSMRRIRLGGEGLGNLGHLPGQDMAIAVPAGDGGTVRRRYTIRSLDRRTGTADLDFVLHGDGPAARWAASAVPGSPVEAVAPRGKITIDRDAEWHLFAGDDAALPGIGAMLESLPRGATARAVIEVGGPDDEQAFAVGDGVDVAITWLHRGGTEPGRSDLLVEAIGSVELPAGRGHAYLAGEYAAVQGLRRRLGELGLEREQISPKPYWRLGRRNQPHGEPERD
jgi:NADPH-dependent ferric siderophore reductase